MSLTYPHDPPITLGFMMPFTNFGRPRCPNHVLRNLMHSYQNWSVYWLNKRADMQAAWGPWVRWNYHVPMASTYWLAETFQLEEPDTFDERWQAVVISGEVWGPDEINWMLFPASIREQITIPRMLDADYLLHIPLFNPRILYLENYILFAIYQAKVAETIWRIFGYEYRPRPWS